MLSVAASTQTGTRVVSAEEMEALAVGAWILGTGGGGDPYQKLLNMRQLYKKGYRASLLDPMYLNEDDRVAVVSGMGAPLVGQERLADPHFAVKLVRMMENTAASASAPSWRWKSAAATACNPSWWPR